MSCCVHGNNCVNAKRRVEAERGPSIVDMVKRWEPQHAEHGIKYIIPKTGDVQKIVCRCGETLAFTGIEEALT